MSAIEEVLWNIFTYYSLNGNPKDPSKLHSMGLLKLCKDIMALDQTMTDSPITQADLHLIYTSVLRSPSKSRDAMVDKSDKLNFDEFLSCISRIAQKCYPNAQNQEESMQQLLMDNILPMAHRRLPTSIATTVLKEPGIEHLLKYYESSLISIFKYFAVVSDQLTKDRNMVRATQHIVDTFDDQIQQIQKANARCMQQNSISKLMSYTDFLKFSSDLGLISSLPITIVEFGDIFLTVTSFTNFTTSLRRIDFSEFCEALVRIALRAFEHLSHVSNEDKVKALFMNMWRHAQELLGEHMLNYGTLHGGGFISAREELLRSVEAFSGKFKSAWARENYCNYLERGAESSNASSGSSRGGFSPKKPPGTPAARGGNRSVPNTPGAVASRSAPSTPAAVTTSSPMKGGVSLLKRLKAGYSAGSAEKQMSGSAADTYTDFPDTMSVRSGVTGRTGTLAETIAEIRSNKEKLLSTLHERTEDSESFVVTAADGGQFRVMLTNTDSFAEGKLVPGDLRRLLLYKPELAAVLYDTLVEEGIVSAEEEEGGGQHPGYDDGLEELGITMDDLALVQDTVGTALPVTPTAAVTADTDPVETSEDCS